MKARLFDRAREKHDLESSIGFELFEKDNLRDFEKNRNLCTGARSKLIGAIRGLLVDMDARAMKQVEAAQQWLDRSIEIGEEGTFAGGRSGIYETYAWSRWLLTGEPQVEIFREALNHQIGVMNARGLDGDAFNVDIAAALCLHAREYKQALDVKARFSATGAAIDKPSTAPRTVAFAIAEGLDSNFLEISVLAGRGSKLLRKHTSEWIGRGHHLTALSWLKIVHWDLEGRSRSPVEVVKLAHEYLKPL